MHGGRQKGRIRTDAGRRPLCSLGFVLNSGGSAFKKWREMGEHGRAVWALDPVVCFLSGSVTQDPLSLPLTPLSLTHLMV